MDFVDIETSQIRSCLQLHACIGSLRLPHTEESTLPELNLAARIFLAYDCHHKFRWAINMQLSNGLLQSQIERIALFWRSLWSLARAQVVAFGGCKISVVYYRSSIQKNALLLVVAANSFLRLRDGRLALLYLANWYSSKSANFSTMTLRRHTGR